jgi:hypothetical protein
VLKAVTQIGAAVAKSPPTWNAEEAQAVAMGVPQLGLLDYFKQWHRWAPGERAAFVQAACDALAQAGGLPRGEKARPELSRHEQESHPDTLKDRGQRGGEKRGAAGGELEKMAAAWRAVESGGESNHGSHAAGLDLGLERWIGDEGQDTIQATLAGKDSHVPRGPDTSRNVQGKSRGRAPAKSASGRRWQAFDVVHHPKHGQGIVVSTTTTMSGREVKVQFVDGSLASFHDDDPTLSAE